MRCLFSSIILKELILKKWKKKKRGKMLRLVNGIFLYIHTTFGELKFSTLRYEVRIQNEDNTVSVEFGK